jgi:hypothetical protein
MFRIANTSKRRKIDIPLAGFDSSSEEEEEEEEEERPASSPGTAAASAQRAQELQVGQGAPGGVQEMQQG